MVLLFLWLVSKRRTEKGNRKEKKRKDCCLAVVRNLKCSQEWREKWKLFASVLLLKFSVWLELVS